MADKAFSASAEVQFALFRSSPPVLVDVRSSNAASTGGPVLTVRVMTAGQEVTATFVGDPDRVFALLDELLEEAKATWDRAQ